MTPEEVAAGVKLMYWDLNAAAYKVGKKIYNSAQKYRGSSKKNSGSSTPATTTSGKPGRQWGSVESTTYFNTQTTYCVHTKKTAKEK